MTQQAEPVAPEAHTEKAAGAASRSTAPAAGLARELRDLLESRRGERHVVAIQDFPDPDAIACGLAYREIARVFEIHTDILYEGMISHPENLALVNLLEIDLKAYTEGIPLERYQAAVFVDNQGTTTRLAARLKEAGVPTLAVVDHHDPQDLLDPVFADIRPVGASATQFAEYLASGELLELDATKPAHVNLATALMHGLHSETKGFIHARKPEYAAAEFLSHVLDAELLERVLCVKKSHGTMDTIQEALARRIIRGGISLAGVGYLRWADRDAIPQAAEFLLSEENVHTAIVYGIIRRNEDREVVSGSMRTANATLGVDSYLKQALGKDVRGRFFGGGRSRAGGFEIDLGFLASSTEDPEERQAKWDLLDRQVRRQLLRGAGLEVEREE